MSTTQHKAILQQLTVLADPEHKGKHPYHDARWIATKGANWEDSDHTSGQWVIENGELICSMRDCTHQGQYARVIAAAPEMLHLLRSATAWIRRAGGDVETLDAFLGQFTDIC